MTKLGTAQIKDTSGLEESIDNSPVGVAIVTQEIVEGELAWKRVYANNALAQMFGFPSVEALLNGSVRSSWVNKAQLTEFENLLASNTKVTNFEAPRYRNDGTEWWVLLNSHPVTFHGQNCSMVWHVDISARKQAEGAQAQLTQAIGVVPVGIALFDPDDRLVFCNDRYREQMIVMNDVLNPGVTFEQMIRTMVTRQPVKNARGREEEFIQERIKQHKKPTGPIDIRREEKWLQAEEIRLDDGSIFTIISDITERRHAEGAVERALADAEQANQAKSEFLATMSHEFRTPLNAILGFSEMLRAQYFGPLGSETYKEYAKDIYESGGHMLALVNDMLDVAAIEAGKRQINKEPLDVNEIAQRCIKDVEHAATEKGINLSLRVSDDVPPLNVDKRSLVQILHNLLSNAVKFTEHDGMIEVVASMTEGSVTICVRDSGVGIAPENLPKIAEPFSQSHNRAHISRDGTGLGLSIVKSLVELHEGTLSIESELGKGTTVKMLFPNQ